MRRPTTREASLAEAGIIVAGFGVGCLTPLTWEGLVVCAIFAFAMTMIWWIE